MTSPTPYSLNRDNLRRREVLRDVAELRRQAAAESIVADIKDAHSRPPRKVVRQLAGELVVSNSQHFEAAQVGDARRKRAFELAHMKDVPTAEVLGSPCLLPDARCWAPCDGRCWGSPQT